MGRAQQRDDDLISVPFPDEPGSVYMTEPEWQVFKTKLGETCALYWCEKAEAYAEEYPRRWAKYKNHFRTLNNWHSMRVADGYEWFEHPSHGPGYYKTWVIDRAMSGGR
jgi:hypothetical protein